MTGDGPAARAREAVSAADSDITLLIDGMPGPQPGRDAVLMLDWGGRPRFVCERESVVQRAASCGRPALLTVRHGSWRVAIAGRLTLVEVAAEPTVATVAIEPAAVFIEPADDDARHVQRQAIPLDAYFCRAAEPVSV